MIAEELISANLFPLKKSDSVETAVMFMHDWKVSHLPVVESNIVTGYVVISDLISHSKNTRIEKMIRTDVKYFISSAQHATEALRIFSQTGISTLSVVDNEEHFKGIISYHDMFLNLYQQSSLAQPGGIITMEMPAIDYSLAELTRIAEYNDVKIIDVHIHPLADEFNRIEVSLKFNRADLKTVVSGFERHGKTIKYIHGATQEGESLTNRYDWLIKYLST